MSKELPVVEIEQPKVTAETKFRRGGFKPAAEVIAEAEAGGTPDRNADAAAANALEAGMRVSPDIDDPEMQAAILADPNVGIEMPEGVTLGMDPALRAEAPAEEIPEEETPPAPGREVKVKLLGREFATQEEAWAYAEELERKQLTADAFQQGIEAARMSQPGNPAPEPPAAPQPEEIDPLYYTNPTAYFQKMRAQIVAEATQEVSKVQQKQAAETQMWTDFYSENPDLAAAKDYVQYTMERNWLTLQHKPVGAALKELAQKARAGLKPIVDSQLPKVALPRVRQAATPGGAQPVTRAPQPKPVLNFAQQMKKIQKSKRAPVG